MDNRQHKLRIGLVGCGYWGSKHLRVFNELAESSLIALCEPSPDKVAAQPQAFLPPLVTGDYDRFLAAPTDAVVIATPARTHYELAKRALEHGKHVLIEKPFTTSADDAQALIHEADRRDLTLAVGHTYVYHPAVEFLKTYIQSGQLGKVQYVHTSRLNFGLLQPDVDVVWDLAPHDLSILLYVLQREPLFAGARGTACFNTKACEVAHIDLEFPDGPTAHIYVSWLEPRKVRRLTFVGDEKTIVYDDVAQGETLRIFDQSIKLVPTNGASSPVTPHYLRGDATIPFVDGREPLKMECLRFLECIRSGEQMRSSGRDGLQVVRVLEAAEKSLYNGGTAERVQMPFSVSRNEGVLTPASYEGRGR